MLPPGRPDTFLMIFGRTELKISLSGSFLCVEFDGDVRFRVAPRKQAFLADFVRKIMFLRFSDFSEKSSKMFSVPTAVQPKTLPPRPPPRLAI